MNNFSLRVIFGSLYVAIVVSAVLFGSPWFPILMALFTLLSILESIKLNQMEAARNSQLTALVYAGIIVYLTIYQGLDPFTYHYAIAWVVQLGMLWFIYNSFKQKGRSGLLFDTLYIWLPLFALAVFSIQGEGNIAHQLLFLFITIWSYDSLAYVSGRLFGKHPLFPKISPKKTWEGAIGGLVLSMTAVYFLDRYWLELPFNAIIAGAIIVLASTAGDFFESFYKRKLGVKDSGNLIPGHGGILDRIDSVLFSCLPFITYITFFAEK